MPRRLGSSVQGFVNKWVNANRENAVYDNGEDCKNVIVFEPENEERPKSTLRSKPKTNKTSGRRRHSQLGSPYNDEPQHHEIAKQLAYHGYDDDKSLAEVSCRTAITASTHSTHSTRRSAASASSSNSVRSASPAPCDDDASASSFNKRMKLSNGGSAGSLPPPLPPPPDVPGVYYGVEYKCHGSISSPPPTVPEEMTEQPPSDVPGVYYGIDYGGSAIPPIPSMPPAIDYNLGPAVLPPPPGLVINSINHPSGVPTPPPPTMQMDHRVYHPPRPGSVEPTSPYHIPHAPSPGPPQEIVALCHPRHSGQPPSPQLQPHHAPSRGYPSRARPVAPPPPVMHFIHEHPPAAPMVASSSQAQTDVKSSKGGLPSNDLGRCIVKTEDAHQRRPQVHKPEEMEVDIQADPVRSSSVVGKDNTVRFASDMDEHTDDNSSAESDTSEIEAKMDAALVLSALSFTKQGSSGGKASGEAKGKKGLLLRKSRSPVEPKRNSPGSMITWRARRAARAADNEYDN